MTHRSTWKAAERKVAAYFDAIRISLSGSNNQQAQTSSDTDSEDFYIEVKYRQRFSVLTLFHDVIQKAKKEKKLPLLALVEKGKPGFFLVLRQKDLDELVKRVLEMRLARVSSLVFDQASFLQDEDTEEEANHDDQGPGSQRDG